MTGVADVHQHELRLSPFRIKNFGVFSISYERQSVKSLTAKAHGIRKKTWKIGDIYGIEDRFALKMAKNSSTSKMIGEWDAKKLIFSPNEQWLYWDSVFCVFSLILALNCYFSLDIAFKMLYWLVWYKKSRCYFVNIKLIYSVYREFWCEISQMSW